MELVTDIWQDNIIIQKEKLFENRHIFGSHNKAFVCGILETDFVYNHRVLNERFFKNRVIVERKSGIKDNIPIIVSEALLKDFSKIRKGMVAEVAGEFRSFWIYDIEGKRHLELFIFVSYINVFEDFLEGMNYQNLIYLDGSICKRSLLRNTMVYDSCIIGFSLVVNRDYSAVDYIPCIAWNYVAKRINNMEIGDKIKAYARIQSRTYLKKLSSYSDEEVCKETYEVSIIKI